MVNLKFYNPFMTCSPLFGVGNVFSEDSEVFISAIINLLKLIK